jgi:hypothetical protein
MKQFFSLFLLLAVYLLVSLRYFPGQGMKTISETLWHLLSIAPYTVGATVVIAVLLRRLSEGKKLHWQLLVRMFITLSIILEIFLGIHDHLQPTVDSRQSAAASSQSAVDSRNRWL